jgi:branched-chain amino acid transport system permease protein
LALFADLTTSQFAQLFLNGLSLGMLIALIALGYTMVYGIIELINFAHGDLFMLGSCLAWTLLAFLSPQLGEVPSIILCFILVPLFCAALNLAVDRIVYKPLRNAPKLAPFVSALGVSFIFMNIGLFWIGSLAVDFPAVVSDQNLLSSPDLTFSKKDALVFGTTIPLMLALTYLVKFTKLGTAMRATAQNPVAARLMGINTEKVIALTFALGGALAGFASVVFGLKINSIQFQMGFTNGLYAFTAAVLGGIGNIPGAVVGALVIGLLRSYGSAFLGEQWSQAIVFGTLIIILVFRPQGLLGARVREKV